MSGYSRRSTPTTRRLAVDRFAVSLGGRLDSESTSGPQVCARSDLGHNPPAALAEVENVAWPGRF
jgi:hypothetical protein